MQLEARIIGILLTKNYEYWFSFLQVIRRLNSGVFLRHGVVIQYAMDRRSCCLSRYLSVQKLKND